MSLTFVAFNDSGQTFYTESLKWLREDGPTELFSGNKYITKEVLTPEDIHGFWLSFRNYLKDFKYIPSNPENTTHYNEWFDKWVLPDGKIIIEDWVFQKLLNFKGLLYKCVELGLYGRWSV